MDFSITLADKIDPVAMYAALVATLVLLWDILKWWRSGTRLRISANSDMETVGYIHGDGKTYILVNVTNTGSAPTTITHLVGYVYKTKLHRWFRRNPNRSFFVSNNEVSPIPFKLEPGAQFTGMIQQTDDIVEWSKSSNLYVGVYHSMRKTRVLVSVPPIQQISIRDEAN